MLLVITVINRNQFLSFVAFLFLETIWKPKRDGTLPIKIVLK